MALDAFTIIFALIFAIALMLAILFSVNVLVFTRCAFHIVVARLVTKAITVKTSVWTVMLTYWMTNFHSFRWLVIFCLRSAAL